MFRCGVKDAVYTLCIFTQMTNYNSDEHISMRDLWNNVHLCLFTIYDIVAKDYEWKLYIQCSLSNAFVKPSS